MIYRYNLVDQPNMVWGKSMLTPTFLDGVKNINIQQNKVQEIRIGEEYLEISFDGDLSSYDIKQLDNIVRKNLVTEANTNLRITKYLWTKRYFEADYDIMGFKKERILVKWELKTINYWANWDEVNWYSDLVVKEENIYNRDEYGYIQTRDKVITWYNDDYTAWPLKHTIKKYSMLEAAKAGEDCRSNIVSDMKIATIWLICQTEQVSISEAEMLGFPFLISMTTQIAMYINGADQPLLDGIMAATDSWMDNDIGWETIRQYLYNWFKH